MGLFLSNRPKYISENVRYGWKAVFWKCRIKKILSNSQDGVLNLKTPAPVWQLLFRESEVSGLDDLRYANIALDIFCIILSILPIVYLISNHRYRQKLNQFFLGACISNVFMIAGDLPDWILSMTASVLERLVLSAATALYYAASAFVLYFFIRYIMEYLQMTGRAKKFCLLYAIVLCGVPGRFCWSQPFYRFHILYNK